MHIYLIISFILNKYANKAATLNSSPIPLSEHFILEKSPFLLYSILLNLQKGVRRDEKTTCFPTHGLSCRYCFRRRTTGRRPDSRSSSRRACRIYYCEWSGTRNPRSAPHLRCT